MIEQLLTYDEVTVSMSGDYIRLVWFSDKLDDHVEIAFHEKDWSVLSAIIDEMRFTYGQ